MFTGNNAKMSLMVNVFYVLDFSKLAARYRVDRISTFLPILLKHLIDLNRVKMLPIQIISYNFYRFILGCNN